MRKVQELMNVLSMFFFVACAAILTCSMIASTAYSLFLYLFYGFELPQAAMSGFDLLFKLIMCAIAALVMSIFCRAVARLSAEMVEAPVALKPSLQRKSASK
ncbi:MAG: hypothetical protein B7Y95_12790 [Rhizobiales bacterium 32-66-11]|jgi:hypothetical protein|nr:MAG: hypothetical protein B7Y95_12790 [Rhizobiales bacterium 32-66-11]